MRSTIPIIILFVLAVNAFAEPSWVNQLPSKHGHSLAIVCSGSGGDRTIAMKTALSSCRSMAANYLNTSINVSDLTVQSESGAPSLHSEITSNQKLTGVECDIKRQEIETGDERTTVFIECEFDTNKIKAVSLNGIEPKPEAVVSDLKFLYIRCVPNCDNIVVKGMRARTVKCSSNPLPLVRYPEDLEVIVRKAGYRPAHLTAIDGNDVEVRLEK